MKEISYAQDFTDGQAHAMSHPGAQAEGVQHVSDAARAAAKAAFPGETPDEWEAYESDLRRSGTVLRTVAEWTELKADLAFLRGLLEGTIEQSIRLRGEICELTKRLREAQDVRRLAGSGDGDSTSGVHGLGDLAQSLTFLPAPDARLGRGNAAMGES